MEGLAGVGGFCPPGLSGEGSVRWRAAPQAGSPCIIPGLAPELDARGSTPG